MTDDDWLFAVRVLNARDGEFHSPITNVMVQQHLLEMKAQSIGWEQARAEWLCNYVESKLGTSSPEKIERPAVETGSFNGHSK